VVNDSGGPKEDIVIPIDGKPTGTFIPHRKKLYTIVRAQN
jgi:hypothetical protein